MKYHNKKIYFAILLLMLGCATQQPHNLNLNYDNSTLPKAPYVLAQTVRQWQKEGKPLVLIDVRQPEEFADGHLENAINIPYFELEKRLEEIDQNKRTVFYCIHSSWRAPYAANLLADLHYKNIYVLEGGISAWNAGGQVIYATYPSQSAKVAAYPKKLIPDLKHPQDKIYEQKIYLTTEQLKSYDGQSGRPAFVAVNGVIYDVTQSRLWRGGEHDPSHGQAKAGKDLTQELKLSPHGIKNLEKFPIVGWIQNTEF
ncbi:MAG: hypothetical protein KC733_01440 [Candidatus Omnitrophica bacterium]|nr:hypothetical protein [Candidatus Omnitrophota bacterium]